MKTFIVLISVFSEEITNPRKLCEELENIPFSVGVFPDDLTTALKIKEVICKNNFITEIDDVIVFPISDFMDIVNNEEFNPDNYFMSYVRA